MNKIVISVITTPPQTPWGAEVTHIHLAVVHPDGTEGAFTNYETPEMLIDSNVIVPSQLAGYIKDCFE